MAETFTFEDVQQPKKGLTLDAADRSKKRKQEKFEPLDYGSVKLPSGSLLPSSQDVRTMLSDAATKYGVPVPVVIAMAQQESGFNPNAVGPETKWGRAKGLMQYLDSTARGMGIDALDPRQAADAAAKQIAERLKTGRGIEWAIAAHHAGDNPKQHGPVTRKYTAEVMAKAAAIAKELGDDFKLPETPADAGPETFSFEDVVKAASAESPEDKNVPPEGELKHAITDFLGRITIPGTLKAGRDALKRGWEGLQDMLDRDTIMIDRDPEELQRSYREYVASGKSPMPYLQYVREYGKMKVTAKPYEDIELEWKQRLRDDPSQAAMLPAHLKHLAPQEDSKYKGGLARFVDTMKNPLELLTSESLPANFVSELANQPELDRKKFDEARKIAMQMNIVSNPDQFPKEAVAAAQKAIDDRMADKPGVGEMLRQMWGAATEDPGRFSGQLVNALLADPELLVVPVGVGIKPIQGVQAARGVTVASRAAKIADAMIDAGTTGAALNVIIGVQRNLAETGEVNIEEAKMNAAMGYAIGGPLGAIFMRGAKARTVDLKQSKLEGTYESILRDRAAADLAVEDVVTGTGPAAGMDRSVRNRIENMLGIKSNSEREAWLKAWREQVRKQFKEESDYYDYQAFKADERMQRAQQIAQEQQAKAAQRKAEADAEQASSAERRARLQREFDDAIEARNNKEFNDAYDAAVVENKAFEAARKLGNEEYLEALFTRDEPTIKQMNAKINRREKQLRMPKWQRGEADPVMMARLGLAVGAGGAAYALSPEDYKVTNTVMAGLAGLLVPGATRGGMSVLSKMRQSGAITPEGDVISMLVRKGKLANKLEGEELLVRDNQLVDKVKAGDQQAFKTLYDEYFTDVQRYVKKFTRELEEQGAVDAETIAQDSFFKAYQNIDQYSKDFPFGAWIKRIARNTALDEIDKIKALKRGSEYNIVGEEVPGSHDAYSGDSGNASNIYDRGMVSDNSGSFFDYSIADTPEAQAALRDSTENLYRAFEKLPPEIKDVMVKTQLENYTDAEVAQMTNTALGTVQWRVQKGKTLLQDAIKSEFRAEPEGRIRGPKNQRGEIDPALMKKMALAGVGAGIGFALSEDSPVWGTGVGVVAGLLASGKVGASIVRGADQALGATSTRVLNHSPKIHRAVVNMFRETMTETHANFQRVDPFISRLEQLPPDVQNVVTRAVLTGDPVVIRRLLEHLGDEQLITGYKEVRSTLDSLGDRLEAVSRFKRKGLREYFPRIVKDKEGLFNAIDKQEATNLQDILKQADVESMRKQGRGLNQAEQSALINQLLFENKRSNQPGWSKDRKIEEITPELLKFYATPAESLHTYIRSAVEDLNKTKMFGKSAKNQIKGDQQFLDVEKSINNLIADEIKSGNLSDEAAHEVAGLLKSVLVGGDRAPAWIIQEAKNLANAGLLGNFWSAATQMGDVVMQVYLQDMRSTLDSVIRQVTGKKFVDMKEFGLIDSITAEFATQSKTAKYVNKIFKYSLFAGVDRFGKNTALNAAISRAQRIAQSESGVLQLANRYADAFGDDFPKLISELKSGKISSLTKEYAFLELSRSQPITKFEMSQWWLDSPNVGRSALVLKSFMLKQFDIARRDGINQIKAGRIAQGSLKLVQLGIVLGLAGTASNLIKQFMSQGASALTGNQPKDLKLSVMDIPLNAIKTFGFNEYVRDRTFGVSEREAKERRDAGQKGARAIKPEPHKAIPEMFIPPFKMWTDIATQDPAMYRYLIPGFGPFVAERMREIEAEEKKERQKKSKGGGTL